MLIISSWWYHYYDHQCPHKRVSNRRNYKLPTFAPAEPSTGAACPGARVAIHQLCNCCHYYLLLSTIYYYLLSTIYYLLSTIHYLNICSPIHPEGMLHLSPHPSLSSTPGFSLPLLHSQGLIITPGVPMTLTRDTWHATRGQVMAVPGARCGPFVRCPHYYQPARGNQPGNRAASLQMWFVSC